MALCFSTYFLFVILFLVNVLCAVSELSLRFVFIIESHEPELAQQIGRAIRMAERGRADVRMAEYIVALDRENEQEATDKLCAAISKGVSMLIDLSWAPWEPANQIAADTGLPLVRTELHSQRLVGALDAYLDSRNATDAAIVLESEQDVDRTLYSLLGVSNVRVWVHAGFTRDTARALKAMRPEPSFYALIGDSGFVLDTYRRAVKEKLVRRSHRWNLVFTDYVANLDLTALVLPTMILNLDPEECCRVLGKEDCNCPADFNKPQYQLISLLKYITESYSKLDRELPAVTVKLDCGNPVSEINMNISSERLYRHFVEDAETNNDTVFFWNGERFEAKAKHLFEVLPRPIV